jgi:hypothetical protein
MGSVKTEIRRKKLIQLIHIGKAKLALTDDAYRAILRGASDKDSCADMSVPELEKAVKAMRRAGFRVQKKLPLRPENIGKATVDQLEYIKGMWELAAVYKTEKALNSFIRRVAKVDDIRFLDVKGAQKAILALRDMMVKAGYDPNGVPQGEA